MTPGKFRFAACVLATLILPLPALAKVQPFPSGFRTQAIETGGATIHTRVGGEGPAVVLLHGFADTGDMWAPLAAELSRDHTVIVPDLRGMGLSSHPETGYEKKAQAHDIARVLDALKISKADLVTHDIGNMVGYAFAAQYPDRVTRWVAMDAPLPGIGPWDEILKNPLLWHFNFRGPDAERLVAGRERIYLDRFYNELSADPTSIDEETRQHYAELYARPGAMHSAFNQFAAFTQDAADNKELLAKGKLTMPVLAIGAEKSFGTAMADDLRFVATNVSGAVIANSGHWLMGAAGGDGCRRARLPRPEPMTDDPEGLTSWTLAAIKKRGLALEGYCETAGCNRFYSFNLEQLIEMFGADYRMPEYVPMQCLECGGRLKFKLAMIPPEA